MLSHPKSTIPFFAVVMLERWGYYGVRGLFILFIVSEITAPEEYAISAFGWGTTIIVLGYLIGGIACRLGTPKMISLIGLGVQTIATLIIAFSYGKEMASLGYILMGIGTGLLRTSILTFLAQLYQRSKLLDSAVQVNYIMSNIGGFLGGLVIGIVGSLYGFRAGLLLSGIIFLSAFTVLCFTIAVKSELTPEREKPVKGNVLIVLLAVVLIAVSFLVYDNATANIDYFLSTTDMLVLAEFPVFSWDYVSAIATAILGIALAIFYSYKKVATTIQLTIGCICAAIAYVILLSGFEGTRGESISTFFIGFYALESLATLFIRAPLEAYVVRKFDIRYSPLIIGLIYIVIMLVPEVGAITTFENSAITLSLTVAIFLAFAVIFIGLYFRYKQKIENESELLDTPIQL